MTSNTTPTESNVLCQSQGFVASQRHVVETHVVTDHALARRMELQRKEEAMASENTDNNDTATIKDGILDLRPPKSGLVYQLLRLD